MLSQCKIPTSPAVVAGVRAAPRRHLAPSASQASSDALHEVAYDVISADRARGAAVLSRRHALGVSTAAVAAAVSGFDPSSAAPGACGLLQAAINAAAPGETVTIPGGVYREKLFIERPVTVQAAPGEAVELVWETEDHYEPVISCAGAEGVRLVGLSIRHASPSVANNYAVFLQGGSVQLEGCTITSSTGTGLAAEGGSHSLRDCRLLQCERHGMAAFGTIEGGECQVDVFGCSLEGNKQNGALIRDGSEARLRDSELRSNGEYGVSVAYAAVSIANCRFVGNRRGSVRQGDGADVESTE